MNPSDKIKQVAQRPRDGQVAVHEIPVPAARPGTVLVANRYSLISAGTERSKVELGSKGMLAKARARPDLVKKVVDRARVEGVRSAAQVTRDRLAGLDAVGYSSAGVVLALGEGVEGLATGDRVACGGAGWATHAEVVAVPRNLVARVPDGVDLADAAYATVGSIAMHGVRQAEVSLGERVGVIGLGLVGQLATRLLGAAGCQAIGVDLDERAVALAAAGGATAFPRGEPALAAAVAAATAGEGLDAVLICAATESPDPLELACSLARDRGRLVVVGDVPIEGSRSVFYDKELELRLARSYGPGRYDRDYEERGRDLPPGYVRWTEQRNMQAFVDAVAAGRIAPSDLTTHRFDVDQAPEAYAALVATGDERPVGILLHYPERGSLHTSAAAQAAAPSARPARASGRVRIGLIGAGSFARGTLLPALRKHGAELTAVVTERGLSAADVADRFGFERATADPLELIEDTRTDGVVIATGHPSHAGLTVAALQAGKAVLVEKPLAMNAAELQQVRDALAGCTGRLMVGFNRRFAPLVGELERALPATGARTIVVRVNAGPLPADHWLHDAALGGGRLIGEGCHFVDLLTHLAASPVVAGQAIASPQPERPIECSDNLVAGLRFANGSVGSLVYTGLGDSRLAKERIEVFAGGAAAVLDDFRRLETYAGGRRRVSKGAQDKGHAAEIERFLAVAAGDADPPRPEGYVESTRVTIELAESVRTGLPFT